MSLHRYSGTSSHPITYANILGILVILSLLLYLKTKNLTFIYLSVAIINIYLILLTGTRAVFVALFVTVLALSLRSKNKTILYVTILFLTASLVLPTPLSERVKGSIDFESMTIVDKSIKNRILLMNFSISAINQNLIFGLGPQKFESEYKKYLDINNITINETYNHAHNDFLDIGAKFGIFSLMAYITVLMVLLKYSFYNENPYLLAVIIMLIVSQLFQSHFAHSQAITFYFTLIFSLLNFASRPNNH